MSADKLSQIITSLTPDRLRQVITGLAEQQPQDNRSGVGVESIVRAIVADEDLGEGSTRFRSYQRVRQAIQDGVGQVPGMRYVHSRD